MEVVCAKTTVSCTIPFPRWTACLHRATIASPFQKGGVGTENFFIALNTVLPMFLIIAAGILVRRLHIMSDSAIQEANTLCFKVFMFILLFYNVYTSDLGSSFNGSLLGYCLAGVFAEFFLGLVLIPRIEPSNPARGVMLQDFFRSNLILLGVPMATALYGEGNLGIISVISAIIVPVFNFLAVLSLELFRGGKPSVRKIARSIARNPIFMGAVWGLLAAVTGLKVPTVIESAVSSMAKAATPLSLLLMGASLNFSRLKGMSRNLLLCTAERTVIMPAVFITLGALLGFRGMELCTIMLVFGTPAAVNSYTMALQMDGDADLAGGLVLTTTATSCVTLFLWIWGLKSMALL